jgi:hypothetical protein
MKHHPAALILIVAAALFTALPSLSFAEERFGPWAYYAPYYFPPDMVFAGRLFCPEDFAPRYESPNPPQPSNAVPPGMIGQQRHPVKVGGRIMRSALSRPGDVGLGRSPLSTPYRPSPRSQREYDSPPAAARQRAPIDRSYAPPPATERPGNSYLPPNKPTPQLSAPGEPSTRRQPSPAAQHETSQRPTRQFSVPERPLVQQVAPKIPDNAFEQLNKSADRVESSEIPSAGSKPAQRQNLRSAPVEKTPNEPAADEQPYAGESPAKKPWTWGRQSPGSVEPRQQVAPPTSRPLDRDL